MAMTITNPSMQHNTTASMQHHLPVFSQCQMSAANQHQNSTTHPYVSSATAPLRDSYGAQGVNQNTVPQVANYSYSQMPVLSPEVTVRQREQHDTNHNLIPEAPLAISTQAIKFLTNSISSFGGTEEEDVSLWLEKIETIAVNHNLPPLVRLSTATSKLSKIARRWMDLSPGDINKSWDSFKEAIIRRFKRRVLFNVVMRKIEDRKWNYATESFQEYAMDKIALIHPLKLGDTDIIHLLINGINSLSIKSVAATIRADSIDHFLEEMHHLTAVCDSTLRKNSTTVSKTDKRNNFTKNAKPKDNDDSTSKNGQHKPDIYCVYCRNKGHLRDDCLKLKRKEQQKPTTTIAAPVVAAVEEPPNSLSPMVAVALSDNGKIVAQDTVLKVVKLNVTTC